MSKKVIKETKHKIISIIFIGPHIVDPFKYILKIPLSHNLKNKIIVKLNKGETPSDILKKYNLNRDNIIWSFSLHIVDFKGKIINYSKEIGNDYILDVLKYRNTFPKEETPDKEVKKEIKKNKYLYHVVVLNTSEGKKIRIIYRTNANKIYTDGESYIRFVNKIEKELTELFKGSVIYRMDVFENNKHIINKRFIGKTYYYNQLIRKEKPKQETLSKEVSNRLVSIQNKETGDIKRVSYQSSITEYDMTIWKYISKGTYKKLLKSKLNEKKYKAYNEKDFGKKYVMADLKRKHDLRGPNKFNPKHKIKSPLKRRKIRNNEKRNSISPNV